MFVVDRLVVGRRLRLGVQRLEHLILEPWHRSRAASLRGLLSRRASCIAAFFARQIEAGEFADDGVAAYPDVAGNFAAGQPGCKAAFQEFDAFGVPGGFVGAHVDGPKLRVITPNFIGLAVVRTAAPRRLPLWRPAIVADRKQPVFDGEPNAFLDQGLCDAGNAGAVGTLSHQLFEIADGRERQRNRNTVGFGFFCGHAKKLAFNGCTEKYLFRVYLDSFAVEVRGWDFRHDSRPPRAALKSAGLPDIGGSAYQPAWPRARTPRQNCLTVPCCGCGRTARCVLGRPPSCSIASPRTWKSGCTRCCGIFLTLRISGRRARCCESRHAIASSPLARSVCRMPKRKLSRSSRSRLP